MSEYLSKKISAINFFMIIGIVFLHSYNITADHTETSLVLNIEKFFTNGVFRFLVPLFFLLSGYLFFYNLRPEIEEFRKKISKRFRTLFLPFLIISGFFTLAILIFGQFFAVPERLNVSNFKVFLKILFINPIPYQLWFIRDLFILVLLSPVIYLFTKYLWFVYIPLLFFIWFPNWQFFLIFDNESILFFSLGALIALKAQKIAITANHNKYFTVITLIIWLGLLIAKNTNLIFEWQLFFHRLSEIFGLVFIWIAYDSLIRSSKQEYTNQSLETYYGYSFLIYLVHEPLLTIIKKVFLTKSESDIMLLLSYFVAPILTISICIVISIVLVRYFPRTYRLITGNRFPKN